MLNDIVQTTFNGQIGFKIPKIQILSLLPILAILFVGYWWNRYLKGFAGKSYIDTTYALVILCFNYNQRKSFWNLQSNTFFLLDFSTFLHSAMFLFFFVVMAYTAIAYICVRITDDYPTNGKYRSCPIDWLPRHH